MAWFGVLIVLFAGLFACTSKEEKVLENLGTNLGTLLTI
jgi:hypothetical protein